MRRCPTRVAAICLIVLALAVESIADVPQSMHVQGRLTDTAGVPVDSGIVTFVFRIYNAETAGLEDWPGAEGERQDLYVDAAGLWNANVGALIPLPATLFATDTSRWLQIVIERAGDLPETLSRIRLHSQPYAHHAALSQQADVADDALALGGLAPSEYALDAHEHTASDINPQGDGSGLDADLLDGLHADAFADSVHAHEPEDIVSQGDGSGLDADMLDGLHADAFVDSAHSHDPVDIVPQGEGSGLDADLLDGQNAADFSPVSHPHDGLWSESGPNYYYNGGRVGIGTSSPEQQLHVTKGTPTGINPNPGSIAVFESDSHGYLSILTPSANESGVIFGSTGASTAAGVMFNSTLTPGGLQFRTAFNVTGMSLSASGRLSIGSFTGNGQLLVTGIAANSTVVLPDSSISDQEMWNEPGIASATGAGFITLTSTTMQTLASVTITTPAAGYISLQGKGYGLMHGTTIRNQAIIQIDQTAGGSVLTPHAITFGMVGYVNTTLANAFPIYVSRIYFKSAGTHTFLLEAALQVGNGVGSVARVAYPILTATYFSTSYGSVSTIIQGSEIGAFESARRMSDEFGLDWYEVDLRELEQKAIRLRNELNQVEQQIDQAHTNPEHQ